jgi:hypothetical protein
MYYFPDCRWGSRKRSRSYRKHKGGAALFDPLYWHGSPWPKPQGCWRTIGTIKAAATCCVASALSWTHEWGIVRSGRIAPSLTAAPLMNPVRLWDGRQRAL